MTLKKKYKKVNTKNNFIHLTTYSKDLTGRALVVGSEILKKTFILQEWTLIYILACISKVAYFQTYVITLWSQLKKEYWLDFLLKSLIGVVLRAKPHFSGWKNNTENLFFHNMTDTFVLVVLCINCIEISYIRACRNKDFTNSGNRGNDL